MLLDPARISPERCGEAATRATITRWAAPIGLDELPRFDAIVTGCAAVAVTGKRCGKGAGYSDLEYAILRELGHEPVPVATTVHDLQLVDDFPVELTDLPLSLICTPTRAVRVHARLPVPEGIDWHRLSTADVAAMPVLGELRAWHAAREETP